MKRSFSTENRLTIGKNEIQTVLLLLAVELVFLVYAVLKGNGENFLHMAAVLFSMSLVSCMLVFLFKADQYLLITALLLMNVGFFMQPEGSALKCILGFSVAYITAFVFRYTANWLSMDFMVIVLSLLQLGICVLLKYKGVAVGDIEAQGALIALKIGGKITILPLEIVKVLYLFMAAIILGKRERIDKKILFVPRELYLIGFTMILMAFMAYFSEFGTVLVLFFTVGILMIIFSPHRKLVSALAGMTVVGAGICWGAMMIINPVAGKGRLGKIYARFYHFLDPANAPGDIGYHGVAIRKALTIGGLLGPDTERYKVPIPMAYSDTVFANLIQKTGILMGFMVIMAYFLLFYRGTSIAQKCRDQYLKSLAAAITIMITVQSIIHIGYNSGIMPITGIPLYIVSDGYTSSTMFMVMLAVLLVISTNKVERVRYDEKRLERCIEKIGRGLLPKRRSIRRKNQ